MEVYVGVLLKTFIYISYASASLLNPGPFEYQVGEKQG